MHESGDEAIVSITILVAVEWRRWRMYGGSMEEFVRCFGAVPFLAV